MKKITITCKKTDKVLNVLSKENCNLSYATASKILRNKDILINGQRIKENKMVYEGDEITLYANEADFVAESPLQIEFEDDNILAMFKPKGIETLDYLQKVEKQLNTKLYAVHRLDRNTNGLLLFAKNKLAEECLLEGFKNNKIEKYYLAETAATVLKSKATLVDYLVKDSEKSTVKIYKNNVPNSKKITTYYQVIKKSPTSTTLEVKIEGGKTHQIRAQLAYHQMPLIGDDKYGDVQINKKFNKKSQMLTAYKLIFHTTNFLQYLNGQSIVLSNCKQNLYVID